MDWKLWWMMKSWKAGWLVWINVLSKNVLDNKYSSFTNGNSSVTSEAFVSSKMQFITLILKITGSIQMILHSIYIRLLFIWGSHSRRTYWITFDSSFGIFMQGQRSFNERPVCGDQRRRSEGARNEWQAPIGCGSGAEPRKNFNKYAIRFQETPFLSVNVHFILDTIGYLLYDTIH